MKNSTRSDLFWQEVIKTSRKRKRNKTHQLEKVVRKFAEAPLSPAESAPAFQRAVAQRIRQEKNHKLLANLLIFSLVGVLLLGIALELVLRGGQDVMILLGIPTGTPTQMPVPVSTATFTPIPTQTLIPTPSPTPLTWPEQYRVSEGDDLMNLKSHLPLWIDAAWLVPGNQATCFEDIQQCNYFINEPIPLDSFIAIFYRDNADTMRDVQFEAHAFIDDRATKVVEPFIGTQILRTSGNALSQDWLFVGVYRWPARTSMNVRVSYSGNTLQDDLLVVRLTEHDLALLKELGDQPLGGVDYTLTNVSEIYGSNSAPEADPIASEGCFKGICMVDNPLKFSNNGLHRAGDYRFLVHIPVTNTTVPIFHVLGEEYSLVPMSIPGWYLTDELIFNVPSTFSFSFTSADGQTVIADAIFALWKDPILTR